MNPSAGSFTKASASAAGVFAALSTPVVPTRTVILDADPAATDPVAAKRAEIRRYFHQNSTTGSSRSSAMMRRCTSGTSRFGIH